MNRCRQCHAEIPAGGQFCPACGADQYPAARSTGWGRWRVTGASRVGLICLAVVVVAILVILDQRGAVQQRTVQGSEVATRIGRQLRSEFGYADPDVICAKSEPIKPGFRFECRLLATATDPLTIEVRENSRALVWSVVGQPRLSGVA
jgi:hypothetical protein